MLCDVCRRAIREGFAISGTKVIHHVNWNSFRKSVDAHCRSCVQFSKTDKSLLSQSPPDYLLGNGRTNCPQAATFTELEFFNLAVEEDEYGDVYPFQILSVIEQGPRFGTYFKLIRSEYVQDLLPRDPAPNSTALENTLPLIKEWFNSCQMTHKCIEAQASGPSPSRLLDLSSLASGCVRLIEYSAETRKDSYMTLSHRWGSDPHYKLESATRAQLVTGIQTKDLPLVYQHAFAVTTSLGCQLLWIDSLCIQQDSAEDWEIQSSQMGDIYRNSLCNIAATDADGSDEGLFFTRDASQVLTERIILPLKQIDTSFHVIEGLLFDLGNRPLTLRAWVVQERYLAPSMLHFGRDQVYWQCRELNACESFPHGINDKIYRRLSTYYETQLRLLLQRPAETFDAFEALSLVLQMWADIILEFTAASLTKPQDKLVAISGIAKVFQRIVPGQYFAGLWSYDIVSQLIWYSTFSGKLRRSQEYRAPSWSWASVDGPLFTTTGVHGKNSSIAELVDARVTLQSADPTGAVSDGFLLMRATILPVHICRLRSDDLEYALLGLRNDGRGPKAWIDVELTSDKLLRTYYCFFAHRRIDRGIIILQGLVLDAADDVPGSYRRVGVFTLNSKDSFPLLQKPLERQLVRLI